MVFQEPETALGAIAEIEAEPTKARHMPHDLENSFHLPRCSSCREVIIEAGGGKTLIPAYPMLLCVAGGTLDAFQAGRQFSIEPGDFALFRAAETVMLDATGEVSSTVTCAELANLDESVTRSHRPPLLIEEIDAAEALSHIKNLLSCQAMSDEIEQDTPYESALITTCLVLLLMRALRQKPADVLKPGAQSDLERIRAYCHENLSKKITVQDLQNLLAMSSSPLQRLVRKACYMSPMAYVRHIRLEHALQLLQNTELRMNEIAAKCGFSSYFRFVKTFKKRYDVSPTAYRVQARQNAPSKGDILMKQKRYQEAADAYLKQAEEADGTVNMEEIELKRGCALYHAESFEQAEDILQRLRGTPYWQKAVPYVIDSMFKFRRYSEGGKLFRDYYSLAQRAGEANEFHALWLRWLRLLRQHNDMGPVEMLLDLRRDFFPMEASTTDDADDCLLYLDRGNEIAPGRPLYRSGLRKAGRYQEIVEDPHSSRGEKANALISMGRFQDVVDEYSDLERHYALALCLLGKTEKALELFPEGSYDHALALKHSGEYERVLSDCRPHKWLCFDSCIMMGDPERILTENLGGFWMTVPALCTLGRTDEAREAIPAHQQDFLEEVAITEAIQQLLQDDAEGALTKLLSIDRITSTCPSHRLSLLPAFAVLAHVDKDNPDLAELKAIAGSKIYAEQQGHQWHALKLMFGVIDEVAYLAQPRQHPDPHDSLPMFRGIREDLAGNTKQAIKDYAHVYNRYTRNMMLFSNYACWHWYLKWRLKELGA